VHNDSLAPFLHFEPLDGWEAAEQYTPLWRELAHSAGAWLPFQQQEWSRTWWRHWARRDGRRSDTFVLWTGRDARGRVRALVPTIRTVRPAHGPWRVRLLSPIGPDPNLTELQPLLCRPEDTAAAHAGLARALRARAGEWDGFRWSSVPSGAVATVRAAPRVEKLRSVPDYVLRIAADWESFRSGLPRNVKEALRKSRNAPARDGVDLAFQVVSDEEQTRRLLPEFLHLHTQRAAAAALPRHPDVFAQPRARAFLEDLLALWCRAGIARMLALFHGERLVACRLAFQMQETAYLYYSGYDPAYAPYSVMTRTLADGLRWAIERGVSVVNLSTGTDFGKTRWHPACVEYETLRQWSPTPRGAWARTLFRLFGGERSR
jgi:CelD/BcsL family acetyltransferase involved in cellulose biosynthesis